MSPDPNYHSGNARLSRFVDFLNESGLPEGKGLTVLLYNDTKLITSLTGIRPPRSVMDVLSPGEQQDYLHSIVRKMADRNAANGLIVCSLVRRKTIKLAFKHIDLSSIPAERYALLAYDGRGISVITRIYAVTDDRLGGYVDYSDPKNVSIFK
jgi:hypothetical protein